MPYTPAYNAQFAKPLVNQLIAIIQRDQAAALGIVNSQLPAITEIHKGPAMRTALPWLTIGVDAVIFDSLSAGTRKSAVRLVLALDVGQFDQEMAQDNAMDYARALDMVVTSASASDFEAALPISHETVPGGMTTPPAPGSVKDVTVEAHKYSQAALSGIDAPVLRLTMPLQFQLEEL